MADWKGIIIGILLVGVGYLAGNLFPLSVKEKMIYEPYVVTNREVQWRDTIIINNHKTTIIEKQYIKDTAYINRVPDSLLLQHIYTRSRQLLQQDSTD